MQDKIEIVNGLKFKVFNKDVIYTLKNIRSTEEGIEICDVFWDEDKNAKAGSISYGLSIVNENLNLLKTWIVVDKTETRTYTKEEMFKAFQAGQLWAEVYVSWFTPKDGDDQKKFEEFISKL